MIRQRYKKNDSIVVAAATAASAAAATASIDDLDSTSKVHGHHDNNVDPPPSVHYDPVVVVSVSHYFLYIGHVISIIITMMGIRLTFQHLYTHMECDMTWSQRQFIPVDIVVMNRDQGKDHRHHPPIHNSYQFYKFIDHRDPRYKHLHTKSIIYANDSSTGWCPTSCNIVLYVPGHGGSYQQSRSLGAHGVQLTHQMMDRTTQQHILHRLSVQQQQQQQQQQQTQIRNNSNNNRQNINNTSIDDFFFDVYAFDFNEEGGAFHASILERQANYIVHVITSLSQWCRSTNDSNDTNSKDKVVPIHIVAHSMGGISTRLALQHIQRLHNHNDDHYNNVEIRNVITLGTPHYMPVWSWDTSIHNLYHRLLTNTVPAAAGMMIRHMDDTSMTQHNTHRHVTNTVSISGGYRDEMIPPLACYLVDDQNAAAGLMTTTSSSSSSSSSTRRHLFSMISTDIMNPATIEGKGYVPPYIGVDHRAIVWCHNLLSQVRFILYTFIHASNDINMKDQIYESSNRPNSQSSMQREKDLRRKLIGLSPPSKVSESYEYLQSLSALHDSLEAKYGWYTAFVMETSLLYNVEIVLNSYAIIGIIRYLRLNVGGGSKMVSSLISILFPPILCTILYYWTSLGVKRKHTIPLLSLLILTFVADTIFILTKVVLVTYVKGCWKSHNFSAFSIIRPASMFILALWISLYFVWGHHSWFRGELVIAVTTTVLVLLWSLWRIAIIANVRAIPQPQASYLDDRQLNYVVVLIWILPPMIIGELYAIIKGIKTWGVYTILLPILIRLALTTFSVLAAKPLLRASSISTTKQVHLLRICRFIVLSLCCWRLLTLDVHNQVMLHPLPTLTLVATTCDTIESLMM